ncbi:MAG TPA: DUF2085 domain-containing protein [Chloroflexaceae bacterium]|nr:DUF2085 domain-containing protein [Chloroflexaceae bacterium]
MTLLGLTLLVLLAILLFPAPLSQKLFWAMGGVCGLRPAHSYFAGSVQLPLEARMTGIYGGVSITLGWLLATRRFGATRLGSRAVLALLALMFLSVVADGMNSTFTDIGLAHPYTSTNITRIVTGLLSGVSIAAVVAWVVAAVARPTVRPPQRLFRAPHELLAPLGLCALFGLLVVSQQPWGYEPIALLSVGGVVLTVAGSLLLPVLLIGGWSNRVSAPRLLVGPGTLALLLAFALLAATASFRWNTIGILG